MKTCREIRPYFQEDLGETRAAELRQHLTDCPPCARDYLLARLERTLLRATLPRQEALELSPDFLIKLRARRRRAQPAETWPFWEFVLRFSKPFTLVAMFLVILIGGLNLSTTSTEESQLLRMENYLLEPLADGTDLILSEDVALTQERVLGTLVEIKEDDNGPRR